MIPLAAFALAFEAAPRLSNPAPIQSCQIRTQAWCLLGDPALFDVTTVSTDKRVWTFRGSYLGSAGIRVVEDRGCSSYPSDIQTRSEGLSSSFVDGSSRYVIAWTLHKDGSCTLRIEIRSHTGRKTRLVTNS